LTTLSPTLNSIPASSNLALLSLTIRTEAVKLDLGVVYLKPRVWELDSLLLKFVMVFQVKHPVAIQTGEMVVRGDIGIKVAVVVAKFILANQPQGFQGLQITIDGTEAYLRQSLLDHFVNLLCTRMRVDLGQLFIDDLPLSG
jgi:hypothetical protein